ncbi:hypothetical protein O3P69_017692 [Scylla paramamosain]|uniref:DNA recombination and repair protein Rad51-like C-terminal domain-containing protein n=1 Tax=Scylla paramamosain TaxID=85552 RepID=A0AAW0TX98_SCYPA
MSNAADETPNITNPAEPNPANPEPTVDSCSRESTSAGDKILKSSTPVRHPCRYTPPVPTSPLVLGTSPGHTRQAIRTPRAVSLVEYLREEPRTLHIDPHLFPTGLKPGDVVESFHYIRCLESVQYPIALASMDEHLARNSDVCLLVVDSLSAFTWYDWIYRAGGKFAELKKYYDKVLGALLANVKKYKVALIAVKQALFLKTSEDTTRKTVNDDDERDESVMLEDDDMEEGDMMKNMMESEYLGYAWVSTVTCRVITTKVRVTKGLLSVAPGNKNARNVDSNCDVKEELFSAEVIRNRESEKLHFVITEEGAVWRQTA